MYLLLQKTRLCKHLLPGQRYGSLAINSVELAQGQSVASYIILFSERMIVVTEWYDDCLENHIKSSTFSSLSSLSRLAQQILSALSYLEERGITHRALAADNVLVTPEV